MIHIRSFDAVDAQAVDQVVGPAFKGQFDSEDEVRLVRDLRADGDVALELVAEQDGQIVGHILFSRLVSDAAHGLVALAPVSALPGLQRQGIGSALIRRGMALCQGLGEGGAVLLGHPAYYPRFGFSPELAARLQAPFKGRSFMAIEWIADTILPGTRITYARAFGISPRG